MPVVKVVGAAAATGLLWQWLPWWWLQCAMVLGVPRVVYLGPTVLQGAEQAWMGCLLSSLLLLSLLSVLPASSSPFSLSLPVLLWYSLLGVLAVMSSFRSEHH